MHFNFFRSIFHQIQNATCPSKRLFAFAFLMFHLIGCDQKSSHKDHNDHHDSHDSDSQNHHHKSPHGGAVVVLGNELYHLEFVLDDVSEDSENASFHCYILDGNMDFVRIEMEEIEVVLEDESVILKAVASRATGEKVGNTAHFSASVDWKKERRFSATIKEITVKGNHFEDIDFRFPEGNEDHKDHNDHKDQIDHIDVSFDRLASFDYGEPEDLTQKIEGEDEGESSQIPETIRELDDKSIALKGFMLPLKLEEGLVTEMLIMRDQSMCCYGTVPKINEWVSVKMEGKGVKAVLDQVVIMIGTIRVGEIRENGYLIGIYEMDGKEMKKVDREKVEDERSKSSK